MTPKPGYKTTEFWITAVSNIVGAVIAILAARGLVSQEEGALWLTLAQAVAIAVIPLALVFINGRYINSRATVKAAQANT
jgi:hypothetical protein